MGRAVGGAGTDELLSRAVANNVTWCASLCPGSRDTAAGVWSARERPLHYFPDAITMRSGVSAGSLVVHVSERSPCSVKDSYADVDLIDAGFHELLAASWIGRDGAPPSTSPAGWRAVTGQAEFERWSASGDLGHLLAIDLVAGPSQAFAKCSGGDVLAGAVATVSDDVVGISNVFANGADLSKIWTEILVTAAARWPGLPVVGYERGPELEAARLAGFRVLGPLRVWERS